ncbi:MAG: hypothetical protein L0Y60_14670 [Beijerinckiaceae bacterium]|nr:hypothetical protein [Beijerinckiaceae bacterium]
MRFEQAVEYILDWEGGSRLVRDTGGLTRYGISQRAFPGVDIARLTRAGAISLYRTHYWDRLDCDNLPKDIRLAAFDCAVNQGVGAAERFLARASSLEEFMALRRTYYRNLARANPAKYSKYLKGWLNRMDKVEHVSRESPDLESAPDSVGAPRLPDSSAGGLAGGAELFRTILRELETIFKSKIAWGTVGLGWLSAENIRDNLTFWLAIALAGLVIYWRWHDHGGVKKV